MATETAESEDVTVEYTNVHGESKTYTFTNVTDVVHAASLDDNPWVVLIGQCPDAENDVLEEVVRVKNEYIFDRPIPRSPMNENKTIVEVEAEEMGYL